MSKQHPGPWNYRLKQEGNGFLITDATGSPFAVVHMTNDPAVAEADTHLIVAVPDLLEASKVALDSLRAFNEMSVPRDMREAVRRSYEHSPEIKALVAAIKKASGE